VCYVPCHLILLNLITNNISRSIQVVKLLIMQSSLAPRHFLPLRSKYSLSYTFIICSSLSVRNQDSNPWWYAKILANICLFICFGNYFISIKFEQVMPPELEQRYYCSTFIR
jgi:hypothetical protein